MLEEATLKRLQELIQGEFCRCGQRAVRFRLSQTKTVYYCGDCFENMILETREEGGIYVFGSPRGLDQSEAEDWDAVPEQDHENYRTPSTKKTRQRRCG